jgi:hypothetical protein
MCYEASIALAGGDNTTLAKSFIISLENAAANWYARLQPISITSWGSIAEDFLSCQQYKRETLSDFFRRFHHLNAQALEVSDE